MQFHKYHGLGNDYIVIDPAEFSAMLTPEVVRRICDRNYGVGSDGILFGPLETGGRFVLRIYNPDGSEAEKSGNGLRIFSRYLWDTGRVSDVPFAIDTTGGRVTARVHEGGKLVTVEMGRVSFAATDIPVEGEEGEVLGRTILVDGREYTYSAATVGNPHCVVTGEEVNADLAKTVGPIIEKDRRFPNRTNVQFLEVIDRENIRIEIWERGAGYTLASGSSSTAAAAVARRLGLCGNRVTVHMPGGTLALSFTDDFSAVMTGPVAAVCDGVLREELLGGGEKLKVDL
ncbi:MAG: diaminopimelate epimerase [Chitinispirillaceae bacterium]|nr:diaminopimelate epimerase [Chitinispirillaceae bacterium]